MKTSRRKFLKKGLAGILLLGVSALPQLLMTFAGISSVSEVNRRNAKRILLISLDGICVAGFKQRRLIWTLRYQTGPCRQKNV